MTHSVLTFVNFGCKYNVTYTVYFRHIMRSTYGKITYAYCTSRSHIEARKLVKFDQTYSSQ